MSRPFSGAHDSLLWKEKPCPAQVRLTNELRKSVAILSCVTKSSNVMTVMTYVMTVLLVACR